MTPEFLRSYLLRIEADLTGNILPFWLRHTVDQARGGFHGSITNDLSVDPSAERGSLLSTRILWTFSAAYARSRDPEHLRMADHAYRDLQDRFLDREHGGYYWSVDARRAPLRTRKQIYGQAFAVYSLVEYHRATGLREPLEGAIALHRLIEAHAADPRDGGYVEAFSREWGELADMRLGETDMNEPKSQNTHLHILEAYTSLLRSWPDAGLRARLSALLDVMLTRILNPRTHHLQLFFSRDWSVKSTAVSYGHDIEAAWLFTEAAEALGGGAVDRIRPEVLRMSEATLAEGVDTDGALFNEGSPAGIVNSNKEWWPQAEAVVGFLNAYQLGGDERFLSAALRCWDFIDRRLIDRVHGEWYRGVTREGALLASEAKVSFWKCPYHNSRACMEAVRRLQSIITARSSTTPSP